MEKNLWINGNELLRILLQGYLDSRKEDEIEGECSGIDDEKRTHKRHQSRTLMTIFGEVIVSRIAYGGRKITSLKPLDKVFVILKNFIKHNRNKRLEKKQGK